MGLKRAKLPAAASITTVAIAMMAMGLFGVFTLKINHWIDQIGHTIDIEAMLDNTISEEQHQALATIIHNHAAVSQVTFISKDEAARRFADEFGEHILDVAGYNPLPASLVIQLNHDVLDAETLKEVLTDIQNLPGITEVIFKKRFLEILFTYQRIFLVTDFLLGLIVIAASFVLISNTIKLTIYAKQQVIQVMQLIGATEPIIKRPFLFEGAFQGLFGGIGGALLLALLLRSFTHMAGIDFQINVLYFGVQILTGIVLGIGASVIGIKKFLTKSSV